MLNTLALFLGLWIGEPSALSSYGEFHRVLPGVWLASEDPVPPAVLRNYRYSCMGGALAQGMQNADVYCDCMTDSVAESYTHDEFRAFERKLAQALADDPDGELLVRVLLADQKAKTMMVTCLEQAKG